MVARNLLDPPPTASSPYNSRHTFSSSSSAVDLSGTGLDVAPSDVDDQAYAHRRPGWSNFEERLDEPGPSTGSAAPRERPFIPSLDASSVSLLDLDGDPALDDDEARLTGETQNNAESRWSEDSERTAGFVSRSAQKYATRSSLKQTLANVFHRASIRVANVHRPYVPLREDGEDADSGSMLDGIEKTPQPNAEESVAHQPSTPLRGRALGILGPNNPVRLGLYKLLIYPYTQPAILALILLNAVALVVQASRTLLLPADQVPITIKGYFHAWEDFVIFVLFILFTIEALGRICISGLFLDPEVSISSLFWPSSSKSTRFMSTDSAATDDIPLSRSASLKRGHTVKRVFRRMAQPFSIPLSSHARTPTFAQVLTEPPASSSSLNGQGQSEDLEEPPTFLSRAMRSDILDAHPDGLVSLPYRLDIEMARSKLVRNIPYLRQGWGRIDFLAILGFWISFGLATGGLERGRYHIGLYRGLSVLRTTRLIGITNGTTTIMRSLKIARPLLAHVIFFIMFAVILFSVIGVQSFKRSLGRNCNLLPVLGENFTRLDQNCGGHINATTLVPSPYLQPDGTPGSIVKGFICPLGQVCLEGENPFSGVQSFDTIYYSILQIVVLASASSWAQPMYQIMASEYLVACVFFIFGVLVLNFWLFNLLVAVITNSFSAIRSGTKKSAFGAAPLGRVDEEPEEGWYSATGRHVAQNRLKAWWPHTRWFWLLLAFTSLVAQATTNADMSARHKSIIDTIELVITLTFDVEIIVRIAVEFPAWRNFFMHGNNWLDLIAAVGSSVIQIPVIRNSPVYSWLTVFQLARFYRLLLVVPRMKPLMLTVFGNMYGLVNMTLFLLLITFLTALFILQLVQGDISGTVTLNFGQLFNSFLGVYQILSGENWTGLLYSVTDAELSVGQAITVCMFLCCWLLFSNFIVMQMFIAVINENFDVAEESKRKIQESKAHEPQDTNNRWQHMMNPYGWLKRKPTVENIETPPSASGGEAETLVRQDLLPTYAAATQGRPSGSGSKSHRLRQSSLGLLQELFTGIEKSDEIPLLELHRARSESKGLDEHAEHDIDRYLDILTRLKKVPTIAKESEDFHRTQTIELIQQHPSYDKTFWIFPHTNPIRRLCQKVVRPSGGERIYGTPFSYNAYSLFQLAILFAVLGSVVAEAVANPLYKREYYLQHGPTRGAWFHVAEATFGFILLVEFVIKVIADGFILGPNSYIRSIWNVLDFVVMVGVLVNVTFTLIFVSGLGRFIRALKALQALRFMTLIEKMRKTFQDLILAGFIRILDAAVLAMLYLIPFSVWGTTIFAGLMNQCNDPGVQGIGDCANEYVNAIHEGNFGFLVPRVWDQPAPSTTFSFDNFPSSLLILFEIVSQTGWIDVMSTAMSITGRGLQPQNNAAQANAIFFVVYNLLGAVVVLTLFVSVIIDNFSLRTGSAYLTEAQREWNDLQKLFKRLKPSKRPKVKPTSLFRLWCYDRAIHKHGWWTRMMTILFVAEILVLMTQGFSALTSGDWHNTVSLIISFVYVVDVIIRLYGLGWHAFRANGWNLFDVLVASGSFTTTLFARIYPNDIYTELLQKLFLVSMAFKLVQRMAILNQLFKTGTASLPAILNLLGLWLTFFFFFSIMFMEVFGLTKWYSAEGPYQNYQTMGSTFLMLVSTSTGEGWNQFMHDHTLEYPRCTQISSGIYQTDCGSRAWAYTLFIAWNLLSMYIFVNMFTGVVVDSFSYVFQSTGGVLKSITRHETRAFKKAWAQFSNPATRLLERDNIAPFLAKLDGVFDVRIYPSQYSVQSILETCQNKETGEIRLRKLNSFLKKKVDFKVIQKRRMDYVRIYHEAHVLCYRNKGILFGDMLKLLAHYKLIDYRDALGVKEREVREEMLGLVNGLVALDKVRSHFRMVIRHRRFLQERARAAAATAQGTLAAGDMTQSPESDHDVELHSEHDSISPVTSPRTSSPELVEGERTSSRENLLDDPFADHSTVMQHYEEETESEGLRVALRTYKYP